MHKIFYLSRDDCEGVQCQLGKNREAVVMSYYWEYDQEAHDAAMRLDGYDEGLQEGEIRGQMKGHQLGKEEGLREGEEKGLIAGQHNAMVVINKLLAENRMDDIRRISTDEEYLNELIRELS